MPKYIILSSLVLTFRVSPYSHLDTYQQMVFFHQQIPVGDHTEGFCKVTEGVITHSIPQLLVYVRMVC